MGRHKTIDVRREQARRILQEVVESASLRQLEMILAFLETMRDHPEYQ